MDRQQSGKPGKEPDLKRPDEAIKDLEPKVEESDAIKGGICQKYQDSNDPAFV